jgi:hypothetical protein
MAWRRAGEAGADSDPEGAAEEVGESLAEAGKVPAAAQLPSMRRTARPTFWSLVRLMEMPFVVPARWGRNNAIESALFGVGRSLAPGGCQVHTKGIGRGAARKQAAEEW